MMEKEVKECMTSMKGEIKALFAAMDEVTNRNVRKLTDSQNEMSREEWNEIFDSIRVYNATKNVMIHLGEELDSIITSLEIIKKMNQELLKKS